ncbi:MAG: dockerin type I repeat-containing protein [Clostridia bacterium]|nr:dockerin type I repeat-containing protein [Clostridia bacterium]
MKKIISVFLIAVLLVTGTVFAFASEKGDVDGDGILLANDARATLRFSVNLDEPTEEQFAAADFDSNGKVEAADARSILRISVGLPVDKKPEKPQMPEKPQYTPSAKELEFYNVLYETAHPWLGKYKDYAEKFPFLKNFQKWCCFYTIEDVFRPALEKAGYTKTQIDLLAPNTFSDDSIAKLLSNVTGLPWPSWFVVAFPLCIPSLLADYYIKTPEAADVYFLYDFYDDLIEAKLYEHSEEDRINYQPRVGDILFITNKTNIKDHGNITVDHTAQIIKIYDDGTFLTTEGALMGAEGDNLARVRERKYRFNGDVGTYEYTGRTDIVVLYAAQPHLSK